jgi:hypothetical protein
MHGMRLFSVLLVLSMAGATTGACSSSTGGGGGGSSSGSPAADAASDTWASWAQGFFATYCVECHAASDSTGRDFTKQAIVVANKDTIKCGVAVQQDSSWSCPSNLPAKQFPISDTAGTNPKPSDADRTRVVAWIAAGCP